MRLYFVETDLFTTRITKLGLEGDLVRLQDRLLENPEIGDTDAGTGGLRKVRISDRARGQGKRGGARVHYLWMPGHAVLYLIFVYGKDERESLTTADKKRMKAVVEMIKAAWDSRSPER